MTETSHLLAEQGHGPSPLRWETLDVDVLDGAPDLVQRLVEQRLDGVTITGVLSNDQVGTVLERLRQDPGPRTEVPFGTMVGRPIGLPHPDDDGTSGPYIEHTKVCRAYYREVFGFDPHDHLARTLAPALGGKPFVPAAEPGGEYNPGQLRWMEPGLGGLAAHVGNEFLRLHREGRKRGLFATTAALDHLSYFVVLQRPDEGGTLSVFELLETDYGHPTDWAADQRDDSAFETFRHRSFDPAPGDLMLFGGGRRWHRVEPVGGTRPRITYGGFCAPSLGGDSINCWS